MEPEPTCIRGERDAQRLHPDDSPRPRSGTRYPLDGRAVHAEDCQTSSRELRECRDRRGHARWPCRKRPRSSAAPRYHSTVIRRCSSAAADGQPSQTLRPSRRARRRPGVLFYLPKDLGAARAARAAHALHMDPIRVGSLARPRKCASARQLFVTRYHFFTLDTLSTPRGTSVGSGVPPRARGGSGRAETRMRSLAPFPGVGKGLRDDTDCKCSLLAIGE